MGVGGVSPARIAPQVRPIGLRRVGAIGAQPGDRFTTGGCKRAHTSREGIAGIGRHKLFVSRQGVALECRGIRVAGTEIADRPVSDRRDLIGRRLCGGVGSTIEEHKIGIELVRMPRHLGTLARLIDAEPDAIEQFGQRQTAGTDHLGQ